MTASRILAPVFLAILAILTAPAARAGAPTAEPAASDQWSGPGGIDRIIATSAGVLAGAGAMSLFIDGWVIDAFTSSSGMSAGEAAAVVQDLESQGGVEAAAILLAGLGGGLLADHLYVEGAKNLPGVLSSTKATLDPSLKAVGGAWDWLADRFGDTSDWLQARSRELWDRWQGWAADLWPTTPPKS